MQGVSRARFVANAITVAAAFVEDEFANGKGRACDVGMCGKEVIEGAARGAGKAGQRHVRREPALLFLRVGPQHFVDPLLERGDSLPGINASPKNPSAAWWAFGKDPGGLETQIEAGCVYLAEQRRQRWYLFDANAAEKAEGEVQIGDAGELGPCRQRGRPQFFDEERKLGARCLGQGKADEETRHAPTRVSHGEFAAQWLMPAAQIVQTHVPRRTTPQGEGEAMALMNRCAGNHSGN